MIKPEPSGIRSSLAGLICLVAITLIQPVPSGALAGTGDIDLEVTKVLEKNLRSEAGASRLDLQQPSLVSAFYTRMEFRAAWTRGARALPETRQLLQALRQSSGEGLSPDYYNLADIEVGLRNLKEAVGNGSTLTPERLAWIDILMSDAYFAYASDLLAGRVRPPRQKSDGRTETLTETLKQQLSGFLKRMLSVGWIQDSLLSLRPKNPEYQRLMDSLAFYRNAAALGGWHSITTQMTVGDYGIGVQALRRRLRATGDLLETEATPDEKRFDTTVREAVRSFQRRHGLEADGMVGPLTLQAMNVPAENRVRAIELNLERLRWLPRAPAETSDTYVLLNLADSTLIAVRNSTTVLGMSVNIAEDFKDMSGSSGKIASLALNPDWDITEHLAGNAAVSNNNTGYTTNYVDFANAPEGYWIRQKPENSDPVGAIKLLGPDSFGLYLHDSPASTLDYSRQHRLTEGTIQVENPLQLASFAMSESGKWNKYSILGATRTLKRYKLPLFKPIDMMVVYRTAWADKTGRTSFRDDTLGHDSDLDIVLRATVRMPASEGLPGPEKL